MINRMSKMLSASLAALRRIYRIELEEVQCHVYAGNVHEGGANETACPTGGLYLARRCGFGFPVNHVQCGPCPECGAPLVIVSMSGGGFEVFMSISVFGAVLLASSLACVVTTVGIYVIGQYERWGSRNAVYFMSFAAGVLISVSFIHIIPESFSMNEQGPVFLLVGFMGLYLLSWFISAFVGHKYEYPDLVVGVIPMLGIGFHSFLDGIIYSVTFNVNIFTGALAAIGMVLHEFPEGIVTFLLLKRSGFNRKKAALYAFLAAAISTPLGTVVSFPSRT